MAMFEMRSVFWPIMREMPRKQGRVARLGYTQTRHVLSLVFAVFDREPFTIGIEPAMFPSTARPSVTNLFQPSLLAWRAQHLAAKASPAKPGSATVKLSEVNRILGR